MNSSNKVTKKNQVGVSGQKPQDSFMDLGHEHPITKSGGESFPSGIKENL